jgi:hypothetical protein
MGVSLDLVDQQRSHRGSHDPKYLKRRNHSNGYYGTSVSPSLSRAKVARDPKPPAPRTPRAKPEAAPVEAPTIPPSIKVEGRVLAKFTDYAGLQNAICARIDALALTRLEIDFLAGLQSGYAGKLCGPAMVKRYGMVSLGAMLGAIGCELMLVESTEATARVMSRAQKRQRPIRQLKAQGIDAS